MAWPWKVSLRRCEGHAKGIPKDNSLVKKQLQLGEAAVCRYDLRSGLIAHSLQARHFVRGGGLKRRIPEKEIVRRE